VFFLCIFFLLCFVGVGWYGRCGMGGGVGGGGGGIQP